MAVLIVLVLFSLVGISLAVTSHWNRERTEKLHQEVRLIKRTNYLTTTLAKTTLDTRQASTTAKSFLVVAVSENGQEKILAQKRAFLHPANSQFDQTRTCFSDLKTTGFE